MSDYYLDYSWDEDENVRINADRDTFTTKGLVGTLTVTSVNVQEWEFGTGIEADEDSDTQSPYSEEGSDPRKAPEEPR